MRKTTKKDAVRLFSLAVYSVIMLVVAGASVYAGASVAFTVLLLVWSVLLVYSLFHIKENGFLFCYLISLFVFLLGREVCYTFFGLERYYLYLVPYDDFAFWLITLSLACVAVGMKLEKLTKPLRRRTAKPFTGAKYQPVSKVAFYACWGVSVLETALRILYSGNGGYTASYTAEAAATVNFGPLAYISGFTPIAICLFLATKPDKRSSVWALVFYEVYGMTTLLTGHRFTFLSITIFVVVYAIIRHRTDGHWIKKWHVAAGVCAIPLLLVAMAILDTVRNGTVVETGSFLTNIRAFFDQQGGSINVIKRIRYYENDIRDLFLCSFDSTRSVLSENALMRFLFGVETYSGNSPEHALYGNSLAHRLSYYEYGNYYLQGRGVGSSYIAELYHDFSVFGVMAGSVFYGYLINRISTIKFDHYAADAFVLMTVNSLILAPRGNFDGFVSDIFSVYSLMGIGAIWLVSNIIAQRSSVYERKRNP